MLKILSDEAIKWELTRIEPEGFTWGDITDSEFIKFRAIAREAERKRTEVIVEHLDSYIKQVIDCERYKDGDALVDPVVLAALDYHWQELKREVDHETRRSH